MTSGHYFMFIENENARLIEENYRLKSCLRNLTALMEFDIELETIHAGETRLGILAEAREIVPKQDAKLAIGECDSVVNRDDRS